MVKSTRTRSYRRYSLTKTASDSTATGQKNKLKLVQVVGDDRMFKLTDEDKRRFAEFHGKLAGNA